MFRQRTGGASLRARGPPAAGSCRATRRSTRRSSAPGARRACSECPGRRAGALSPATLCVRRSAWRQTVAALTTAGVRPELHRQIVEDGKVRGLLRGKKDILDLVAELQPVDQVVEPAAHETRVSRLELIWVTQTLRRDRRRGILGGWVVLTGGRWSTSAAAAHCWGPTGTGRARAHPPPRPRPRGPARCSSRGRRPFWLLPLR